VDNREEWLARTLVELADTLVADFDVVDFLSGLVDRCVELVDAAEAGLVLVDQSGNPHVMASSTERAHALELFEVQTEEGPCFDCYRTGNRILNASLDDADERWPKFAPMARKSGYRTAHALPMRLRTEVIGALNVFHKEDRELAPRDAELVQALTDAATIGLLQERAIRKSTDMAGQLQGALNSRVVVEQAKGILAERLELDMKAAFASLRSYARGKNLRLSDVAGDIVRGKLRTEVVRAAALLDAPPAERA
jgi:transcriptional regulator with GAF, ATPase, and Fis domain